MQINPSDIDTIIENVEMQAEYINRIVEVTTQSYTSELDKCMEEVSKELMDNPNPPMQNLEKHFLNLSNAIYFVAEKTEKIGILDGVSKVMAREIYNNAYLESQSISNDKGKKPTVGESTAKAENESLENNIVNEIYSRAYKIVKTKVDAANTMISTISKIISRRMSEVQFSVVNNGTRQILNEEVTNNFTPF